MDSPCKIDNTQVQGNNTGSSIRLTTVSETDEDQLRGDDDR